jgi:hypothetical protein
MNGRKKIIEERKCKNEIFLTEFERIILLDDS